MIWVFFWTTSLVACDEDPPPEDGQVQARPWGWEGMIPGFVEVVKTGRWCGCLHWATGTTWIFFWFLATSLGTQGIDAWGLMLRMGIGLCHSENIQVSELPWVLRLEAQDRCLFFDRCMAVVFLWSRLWVKFLTEIDFPYSGVLEWILEQKRVERCAAGRELSRQTQTRRYSRQRKVLIVSFVSWGLPRSYVKSHVHYFLYLFISSIRSLVLPCGFCCLSMFQLSGYPHHPRPSAPWSAPTSWRRLPWRRPWRSFRRSLASSNAFATFANPWRFRCPEWSWWESSPLGSHPCWKTSPGFSSPGRRTRARGCLVCWRCWPTRQCKSPSQRCRWIPVLLMFPGCVYSPRFAWGGRPHRKFISVRERG